MGASHIGARSDGVEYRLGRPLPDGMAERLEAVAAGGQAMSLCGLTSHRSSNA